MRKQIDPELFTEKITTNNKTFLVDLKENQGGYYLKISEWSNNKKSSIFVPSEGIDSFIETFQALKDMIAEREDGLQPRAASG